MLRSITIRQLGEWRAYADLEPFDEERADLRAASIVQELRNLLGRKKGQAAIPIEKCVVRFGEGRYEVEVEPTPEQARASVRATMDTLMQIFNQPEVKPGRKRGKR
jgi:hypothetical protein